MPINHTEVNIILSLSFQDILDQIRQSRLMEGLDKKYDYDYDTKRASVGFNFIDYFIDYTKYAESPTEFWRWAAITGIAATLRANVFIQTQVGTIYPNIYTILYSDSGVARKGAPCKIIGKLVKQAGTTKFIEGRASMQGVIRELGMQYTNEFGHVISGASGILYSEELSSFMVADPATIPILTDIYDYHEQWSSTLIASGQTKLKELCVCMLAASNSDMFRNTYTEMAIKGGLLGRTFIINEAAARHKRSLLDLPNGDMAPIEPLINHLRTLTRYKGPVKCTSQAQTTYNEWYYQIPDEVSRDKIGFGSRLGTHVLKVAISLAASREEFNYEIIEDDILQSIDLIQKIRKGYRNLMMGIGSATNSYQISLVVKAIAVEKGHCISREKLVQRVFGDVDLEHLDEIVTMLTQAGYIVEKSYQMQPGYALTTKGVDVLVLGEQE